MAKKRGDGDTIMVTITSIDIAVFPDYCGGTFTGNAYIDPNTGKLDYFNTFASEELVAEWRKRAEEVPADPQRMLIHARDAENSSARPYLEQFAQFLDDLLEPTGRYLTFNGHRVEHEPLRQRLAEKGLVLAEGVVVVGYGHHRGDCVSRFGREVTKQLGLDEKLFQELPELSVGDKLLDRLDIVRRENPVVFSHYSDEHCAQLRAQRNFGAVGGILDARKYLFVYCTAEQVRIAARGATSVEDFETRIGGKFRGFKFFDDYLALCRQYGVRPT